ncbi:MAG: MarR family winged helix-turn-helix transcriptional regulator [Anaerolineales bacterium]|nr:MarR family winged helix-turn-helix transcriptional regulator [Anaerolineales bacterium]
MKENPPFSVRLQHLISFWLRLAMQSHYRFIKQQGLSVPQMMILYHVQRMGGCTVSEIAEEFGISNAAASQLIDRLVQQGYLTRKEHPLDRRSKETSLTEAGQKIIEASMNAHQSWVTGLAAKMDENTQQRLLPLLDELVNITHDWFAAIAICDE